MKQYRTQEQLESIFDSAENGNWSQAYEECVEAGVYGHDLVKHIELLASDGYLSDDCKYELMENAVYIIEGATKLRGE